jgi:hypothetical protein
LKGTFWSHLPIRDFVDFATLFHSISDLDALPSPNIQNLELDDLILKAFFGSPANP